MNHPNAIRLEAFAAGAGEESVALHVAECTECTAYVDRARKVEYAPVLDVNRLVVPTAPRAQRFAVVASSVLVPLCMAAAALLWVMPARAPSAQGASSSQVVAAPSSPVAAVDPETTFKGGLQVAVIRERDGAQERFVGAVPVRPGDRLRVEVALDRTETILGAVLGDDGSYIEVMPGVARGAGTHFSESSAKVDDQPLRGTVIVGPADAVRQAKTTRSLNGLATVRIEWEAP